MRAEFRGEGLDQAAQRHTDIECHLEEIVVFFPPGWISSLEVVHEAEREVETVDLIRQVVGASPIVSSGPKYRRVDVAEIMEWGEDDCFPYGQSSSAIRPASMFHETGTEDLGASPDDTDHATDKESVLEDGMLAQKNVDPQHTDFDCVPVIVRGRVADEMILVGCGTECTIVVEVLNQPVQYHDEDEGLDEDRPHLASEEGPRRDPRVKTHLDVRRVRTRLFKIVCPESRENKQCRDVLREHGACKNGKNGARVDTDVGLTEDEGARNDGDQTEDGGHQDRPPRSVGGPRDESSDA